MSGNLFACNEKAELFYYDEQKRVLVIVNLRELSENTEEVCDLSQVFWPLTLVVTEGRGNEEKISIKTNIRSNICGKMLFLVWIF